MIASFLILTFGDSRCRGAIGHNFNIVYMAQLPYMLIQWAVLCFTRQSLAYIGIYDYVYFIVTMFPFSLGLYIDYSC